MLDTKDMKTTYKEAMTRLVENDERVYILEADLMASSGTQSIQEKYPDRVINVGIEEANMIGVAAGMSTCGKIPFCDTFGCFATRRCYDQITVSVCYAKQNVKIVGTDPGVGCEHNGGTHCAVEDMGIMRTLPTMSVFEPADNIQLEKAIPVLADMYGPLYTRLFRRVPHKIYDEDYVFTPNKADIVREGTDVTVIAAGNICLWNAIEAGEMLAEKGISVRVVNMHTIKPIDANMILKSASETGAVVTAENANVINGLGSAVAEVLCENSANVPFKRVGIMDRFGEVGTRDYLIETMGLTKEDIAAAIEEVVAKK